MTYEELISIIDSEVRDQRSWPLNGTADKLDNQLRVVFGAVIAQAMNLPLGKLTDDPQSSSLPAASEAGYSKYTLPATLFYIRPELGIIRISIDGTPYDFNEAVTDLFDFKHNVSSYWMKGQTFFHVDPEERVIRSNGAACDVSFVPLPTEPTDSNYTSLKIPLPAGETDRLVQLAAQHIEAVKNGNPNKSAVHNALSQLYGVVSRES